MKKKNDDSVFSSRFNNRRDFIMGGVAIGASAGLMVPNVASAAITSDHYISVGNGGMFASLHAAAAAAALLNPTASNWVVISMLPGSYDLTLESTELELPDFTELTGVSRHGCIVLGNGNKNIRVNAHNRISNCTIKYSGVGNRSGAIRQQEHVSSSMQSFLDIDNVNFDIYSTKRCAIWVQAMERCIIRNCFIQTSGIGVEIAGAGQIFISGTHCRLVGNAPGNTNPHYAIRLLSVSTRIWVDGGTWATGYGSPEINDESGADIVIFQSEAKSSSRMELNNVWSIARNNSGTLTGTRVTCADVAAPSAWIRVRGGYFQAEDPGGAGMRYDLMNSGGGRLEVQSPRYKTLFGNSYSANGAGVRTITDSFYNPKYNDDGIKLIDASGNPGGMVVMLSEGGAAQIIGAEQVIIRIDDSGNEVIIDGHNTPINGAFTRTLGSAKYSKMVLRYVGSIGWIVLHE
ncbi:MAG: hypothetical protein H6936_00825 [Burkholderiales bacterium]|nr:hypothetical protein [Nitrosomonas sp.]MCP5273399.1 hypothetical protein [Burkholderiales bacterium]